MTLYIDLKPTLEWYIVRTQYTIEWRAKTPFGWYIHSNESDTPRLWFSINPDRDYHVYINYEIPDHKESKRFEAVRTAAQADYERRTAERFRPIVLPDRMNAREGDGSVHYCTGWNDVLDAIAKARGEG